MQLCFFQDPLSTGLHPLTLTRPADQLRVGILKISEKWEKRLKSVHVTRTLPPYMSKVFPAPEIREDEPCLWINGRFLPDQQVIDQIQKLEIDEGLTRNHIPVVAKLSGRRSSGLVQSGNLSPADIDFSDTEHGVLLNQPWQIFAENSSQIAVDISIMNPEESGNQDFDGVHFVGRENVIIDGTVTIEPGCVIHAAEGPVYLGDNVHIMAGSLVRGPVALCNNAVVKMGAKVYEGTTIGPWCKVGGEVNNVVFQAYSNKAHEGFLGNSVIGEWCNFGADTNNSNMKNNYSTVRLTDWVTTREYDTELQFCGTIMGDHSKTAINTMLNTGTVCGVSSNIFSGKFPPKLIKSFRWVGPSGEDIYKFDKAMEAAEKMMARRNVELTPEYRSMMRHIFEKAER